MIYDQPKSREPRRGNLLRYLSHSHRQHGLRAEADPGHQPLLGARRRSRWRGSLWDRWRARVPRQPALPVAQQCRTEPGADIAGGGAGTTLRVWNVRERTTGGDPIDEFLGGQHWTGLVLNREFLAKVRPRLDG